MMATTQEKKWAKKLVKKLTTQERRTYTPLEQRMRRMYLIRLRNTGSIL